MRKDEKRNVKIPITALSRARTRTRTIQEFFPFCCHKCHTVIVNTCFSGCYVVLLMDFNEWGLLAQEMRSGKASK